MQVLAHAVPVHPRNRGMPRQYFHSRYWSRLPRCCRFRSGSRHCRYCLWKSAILDQDQSVRPQAFRPTDLPPDEEGCVEEAKVAVWPAQQGGLPSDRRGPDETGEVAMVSAEECPVPNGAVAAAYCAGLQWAPAARGSVHYPYVLPQIRESPLIKSAPLRSVLRDK